MTRSRPRRNQVSLLIANGVPLVALGAWWWLAQRTPEFVIPDPVGVAEATWRLMFGAQRQHTLVSAWRILASVSLAMILGVALAFLGTIVRPLETLVGERIIPFFNSIPALGWAILGVIWFGIGNSSVIFVLVAICLPFVLVNLWEGLRSLDPQLREMGRSFTRTQRRVMLLVEAPLLIPASIAALRLSFSVAWKVALIAEFFGARHGLGLVMSRARTNFDTTTVFATIVVVLIIVASVERLVFDPLAKFHARRVGATMQVGTARSAAE